MIYFSLVKQTSFQETSLHPSLGCLKQNQQFKMSMTVEDMLIYSVSVEQVNFLKNCSERFQISLWKMVVFNENLASQIRFKDKS